MAYDTEKTTTVDARKRHGSPTFYELLESMARIHDRKSHDYASDNVPMGNYHFAGFLSQLFKNSNDAGFVGRIGEKLFRLANLENSQKLPLNESIEDTEMDLCVIMTLWMSDRRNRRMKSANRMSMADNPFDKSKYDEEYQKQQEAIKDYEEREASHYNPNKT